MAMVDADWKITRSTKVIDYIGGDHDGTGGTPSYATVIQFRRWLGAFADDAVSSGDDEYDITDATAADRKTDNYIELINGYTITDTAAEHLYDGSILQGSGDTQTIYDGIVNYGNATVQIQIHQNGQVLSDDWWNKSTSGTATAGSSGSVLEDSGETWTADEWIGYTIYNTTDGSQGLITDNTADTITATLYGGTGNDFGSGDTYIIGKPLNPDATNGISHRFMIKTREYGLNIDGRRLLGTTRRYGNTYSEFRINGTARGNNVLALVDATDLNNSTSPQTVDDYDQFVNDNQGYIGIDVNNDGTNEYYYSSWDFDGGTLPASPVVNDFYEWHKLITGDTSTTSTYGINGQLFRGITHEVDYDGEAGTGVTEAQLVVWGTEYAYDAALTTDGTIGEAYDFATSGAKGWLLGMDETSTYAVIMTDGTTVVDNDVVTRADGTASDGHTVDGATSLTNNTAGGAGIVFADDTTGDTFWMQLIVGTVPADNQKLYAATIASATAPLSGTNNMDDANSVTAEFTTGSLTDRSALIKTPPVGASTGSAIIGSYGLGIDKGDLADTDKVFDLTNTQITPPNNVTFTVDGLVDGDRVLVTQDAASNIDYDQLSLQTTLNASGQTAIVCTTGIPSDTPSTGTVRVQLDDGRYRRVAYTGISTTSITNDTFDTASTDWSDPDDATAGNNIFISYIDDAASGGTGELSFTGVYLAGRTVFIRVRDGGASPIRTFETTGSWGNTDSTVSAIRTSDE